MKNVKIFGCIVMFVSCLNGSIDLQVDNKKRFQESYKKWLDYNFPLITHYYPQMQTIISRLYLTSISNLADQRGFVCDQRFIDQMSQDILKIECLLISYVKMLKTQKPEQLEADAVAFLFKELNDLIMLEPEWLLKRFKNDSKLLTLITTYKVFDERCRLLIDLK